MKSHHPVVAGLISVLRTSITLESSVIHPKFVCGKIPCVGGMLGCLDLTGSGASIGTTPLGFGIQRFSWTGDDYFLERNRC